MLTKPLLSAIALVAGCSLDGSSKDACNLTADCLPGHVCVNRTCVESSGGSPDARGKYYGTVEPLASQSTGVAVRLGETLVAVTTAPDTLGCAVVGDIEASPGPDTAVVYAQLRPQSSDARCPTGVYAIVTNPSACMASLASPLGAGCSLYKRWDASGQVAAFQLATGGFVALTRTTVSGVGYRCTAELSIRFPGDVLVEKTWTFEYGSGTPGESFCQH